VAAGAAAAGQAQVPVREQPRVRGRSRRGCRCWCRSRGRCGRRNRAIAALGSSSRGPDGIAPAQRTVAVPDTSPAALRQLSTVCAWQRSASAAAAIETASLFNCFHEFLCCEAKPQLRCRLVSKSKHRKQASGNVDCATALPQPIYGVGQSGRVAKALTDCSRARQKASTVESCVVAPCRLASNDPVRQRNTAHQP